MNKAKGKKRHNGKSQTRGKSQLFYHKNNILNIFFEGKKRTISQIKTSEKKKSKLQVTNLQFQRTMCWVKQCCSKISIISTCFGGTSVEFMS